MSVLATIGDFNTVLSATQTVTALIKSGNPEDAVKALLGIGADGEADATDAILEKLEEVATDIKSHTATTVARAALDESLAKSKAVIVQLDGHAADPGRYDAAAIVADADLALSEAITYASSAMDTPPSEGGATLETFESAYATLALAVQARMAAAATLQDGAWGMDAIAEPLEQAIELMDSAAEGVQRMVRADIRVERSYDGNSGWSESDNMWIFEVTSRSGVDLDWLIEAQTVVYGHTVTYADDPVDDISYTDHSSSPGVLDGDAGNLRTKWNRNVDNSDAGVHGIFVEDSAGVRLPGVSRGLNPNVLADRKLISEWIEDRYTDLLVEKMRPDLNAIADATDVYAGVFGGDQFLGSDNVHDVIVPAEADASVTLPHWLPSLPDFAIEYNSEGGSLMRGRDFIDGKAGNDTLDGGANDDVIYGGIGDDSLSGGAGDDVLRGGNDSTDDLHTAARGPSEGGDTLDGGDGDDTVDGGMGADRIAGGRGDDLLDGGSTDIDPDSPLYRVADGNSDTFVFADPDSTDTIRNFDWGDGGDHDLDVIELSVAGFAALGSEVDPEEFADSFAEHDAQSHLIFEGGDLYYDADGLGGEDALHFATLELVETLSHEDFLMA